MRSALLIKLSLHALHLLVTISYCLWSHKQHIKCLRCPATSQRTDLPTFFHVTHRNYCIYFIKIKCILDDETRVVLEEIPGVLGSDYINASWINVRYDDQNFKLSSQYNENNDK